MPHIGLGSFGQSSNINLHDDEALSRKSPLDQDSIRGYSTVNLKRKKTQTILLKIILNPAGHIANRRMPVSLKYPPGV
jgi:hypothetical protein